MSPLPTERGVKEISQDIDRVIEEIKNGKNLGKKLEELESLSAELKTFKERKPS